MGVLVYLITKPLMQYVAILLLQPCSNFKKMLDHKKFYNFWHNSQLFCGLIYAYITHMHLLIHFLDFIKERYLNIYIY